MKRFSQIANDARVSRRIAMLSSVLVAGFVIGCGGGGSASTVTVTPPPNGSYAGTYVCHTLEVDANFTAILTTATGAFSSCSGYVGNQTVKIACTGSITADGTFNASGVDTNGITSTYVGVADETTVTGTFTASAPASGDFTCTH